MPVTVPSRRQRLRAEAHAEIGTRAMAQVAGGGPAALSLSAIARDMGMSGPAIYRYFASREALLARLVADVFTSLGDALERALAGCAPGDPVQRVEVAADAYRVWALAHPREYVLITARVSDEDSRSEMLAATERALALLTGVLGELMPASASPDRLRRLGVLSWQRMHGHVALELEGIHTAMGLDSAALFADEVAAVVSEARRR